MTGSMAKTPFVSRRPEALQKGPSVPTIEGFKELAEVFQIDRGAWVRKMWQHVWRSVRCYAADRSMGYAMPTLPSLRAEAVRCFESRAGQPLPALRYFPLSLPTANAFARMWTRVQGRRCAPAGRARVLWAWAWQWARHGAPASTLLNQAPPENLQVAALQALAARAQRAGAVNP